jgi:hypothetical protein
MRTVIGAGAILIHAESGGLLWVLDPFFSPTLIGCLLISPFASVESVHLEAVYRSGAKRCLFRLFSPLNRIL